VDRTPDQEGAGDIEAATSDPKTGLRWFDWGIPGPPFPPFFRIVPVVAAPKRIVAGAAWQKVAALADPLPHDNYEGAASHPSAAQPCGRLPTITNSGASERCWCSCTGRCRRAWRRL